MRNIQRVRNTPSHATYEYEDENGDKQNLEVSDPETRAMIDTLGKSLLKDSFLKEK